MWFSIHNVFYTWLRVCDIIEHCLFSDSFEGEGNDPTQGLSALKVALGLVWCLYDMFELITQFILSAAASPALQLLWKGKEEVQKCAFETRETCPLINALLMCVCVSCLSPGEENSSRILRWPASVHIVGEGAVRLHHGWHAQPLLSNQEEAEGRRQTGVTSRRASSEQSCCMCVYVLHDNNNSSLPHPPAD